jgi:hypothetical protein
VKTRTISKKEEPSISIQASPINFVISAMRKPNSSLCSIHPDPISDFACPPNKFFGRRGMRLPAADRDFGLKLSCSIRNFSFNKNLLF